MRKPKEYTPTQEKTLDYLEKWESQESLDREPGYVCKCKDCGTTEALRSAGTVSALFMPEHMGHKTFIQKLH